MLMQLWSKQDANRSVDAFETEALALLDNLFAVALQLTSSGTEAEALVCDTYRTAFTRPDRPFPGSALKLFMFVLLHELDERAHSRSPARQQADRERQGEIGVGIVRPAPDGWLNELSDSEVQVALGLLPTDLREAIWLRDFEAFSYAEIALILQKEPAVVTALVSRSRRLLYERLLDGALQPSAGIKVAVR